ncbi:Kinesin-like protein kif24 [Apophysomyces sp. BC1034]|nr:Kinesin-like protein kif24 [Apophysomyces sp. BC1015]KAG0191833.1 Kinesin-like protein kif24 [Apophysomyces sp. BC1034]
MSASVFLDTLRKHDLEQVFHTRHYPSTTLSAGKADFVSLPRVRVFNTLSWLTSSAQLSVQDYAQLGITDTADRKKIFGLIQLLRKETGPGRLNIMTSASTATSGLRQPQTYPVKTYHDNTTQSPTSPSTGGSRLPQPQTATLPSIDSNRYTRARRQSLLATQSPPLNKSTIPFGSFQDKPTRTRTMSDAGRVDMSTLQRSSIRDRRSELRRSLFTDNSSATKDESSEDEDNNVRRYRASAPLLDAYGVPKTNTLRQRPSISALKYSATSASSTISSNIPPSDLNQKIRVCVRKRPLNRKEIERAEKDIAPAVGTRSIQINEPKMKLDLTRYIEQHTFTFDDVFDSDAANTKVYERTALPLVNGQTGSGKTFTMLDPRHGLYVVAARDIFATLRKPENEHLSAWIGLYEIYQGQLYDLLNNRKKLFAREDGKHNVIISNLREFPIDNVDKLIQVFEYGSQVRSTGATGANDSSSRSHAVLQILLKPKKNKKKIHGKLSFIDLAGSERGADRGEADTKTRMEGAEINKSLLALKECIRALDQDKRHTPFRQSKLTQVLKDSFVGNSRTCMIATISPGGSNSEHTLNTLRYADRVKELKGERDRRAHMERTSSGSGNSATDDLSFYVDGSQIDEQLCEDEDDDDKYMQDDSNGEYYSNDDSDILDDDTFNVDEENIFDVDFPHEEDAFIRSNAFASPSHKPLNTRPNNVYHHRQQPSDSSQEDFHAPNSPLVSRIQRWETSNQTSLTDPMLRSFAGLTMSSHTQPKTTSMLDSMISTATPQHMPISTPQPSLLSTDGLPQFDMLQMDEFVKFHRAQIREVTECTKRETKLVTNISLDLSSNQDYFDLGNDPEEEQDTSLSSNPNTKSSNQFHRYLQDLDEVLEQKLAAVEALRDRISDTVGQVQL